MSSIGPTTILRLPRDGSEKTFCVLGCPRGGTSMVSGLLSQMGVPMGATPDDPNQEDTAFTTHSGRRQIFTHAEDRDEREEYLRHISGVIEKRNISKPVWGWKDPISSYYVETAAPLLRNPHYVVVTRDPGAVATRELAYENPDDPVAVSLYMRRTLEEYAAINEFVLHTDAPVLVISYERALRHQEGFIRGLYEFVHPDEPLANSDLDALVRYIQPERSTGRTATQSDSRVSASGPVEAATGTAAELASTASTAPTVDISEVGAGGATALFGAAADYMIAGHHKEADALAAASLLALIDRAPVIRSGPIRVATVASTLAPGVADLVVGCFNIRGLAALEHNDPAAAHQYFAAGYQVAVATLQLQPASPVCVDLVWWLAFHAATSAQAVDLPAATTVAGQYAVQIGHMTTINQTSAAQMRARAIDEGLLQA